MCGLSEPVLYEMLTGQRAFAGGNVSDTLATVLKSDPAWQALPAETPPAIKRLLHRCLGERSETAIARVRDRHRRDSRGANDTVCPHR